MATLPIRKALIGAIEETIEWCKGQCALAGLGYCLDDAIEEGRLGLRLEGILKPKMRKPETKLMCDIFGRDFTDADLYETWSNLPLRTVLFNQMEDIQKKYRRTKPAFAARIIDIVSLRYGFQTGQSATLEAVAKKHSVTRERIRQMLLVAERLLRHPSRLWILKHYVKEAPGGTDRVAISR